jgi:hypothetical protein
MSDDYEIKMDGEQHQYASGAVRYIKDKGDFNLIPTGVVDKLLDWIGSKRYPRVIQEYEVKCLSDYTITAMFHHDYESTIINIIIMKYIYDGKQKRYSISHDAMTKAFVQMLLDLAIHYQKGAQKYGVDNWKKGCENGTGIPDGSFFDSGVRHTLQFIAGYTDEPHHISAIWNFFGAIYMRDEMWKVK